MLLKMLVSLSGDAICLVPGDEYDFPEAEAKRLIKKGFAKEAEAASGTAAADTATINAAVKKALEKNGKPLTEKDVSAAVTAAVEATQKAADAQRDTAVQDAIAAARAEFEAAQDEAIQKAVAAAFAAQTAPPTGTGG